MKANFFGDCAIRNFDEGGRTYLCAIDFNNILGYKNNTSMYLHCPKESRKVVRLRERAGIKNLVFVDSSSVLELLEHCRAKQAKPLKDWVQDLILSRQEQSEKFCEGEKQAMTIDIERLRVILRKAQEAKENMRTDYFDNHAIRYFRQNEKIYFCSADVCNAIQYKTDLSRYLRCPDKCMRLSLTENGELKDVTFYESDFILSFLNKARAMRAKALIIWIGNRISGKQEQDAKVDEEQSMPKTYAEALRELAKQVEEKEALQAKLAEQKAKASNEEIIQILGELLQEAQRRKQEQSKE